jgi:hypothetical protein
MVLAITETLPGIWWASTYGGGIIEYRHQRPQPPHRAPAGGLRSAWRTTVWPRCCATAAA